MAEIINLRQARKRKQRGDKARAADENRVKHGRSTEDAKHVRLEKALDARRLEGHRRAPAEDGDA
jgi:hypothetical protein